MGTKNSFYNNIGDLGYYINYPGLVEALQPTGNYYIIDAQQSYDLNNGMDEYTPYGDYSSFNVNAIDRTHRLVRAAMSSCNPAIPRRFTLPSSHVSFEWNLFDDSWGAPTQAGIPQEIEVPPLVDGEDSTYIPDKFHPFNTNNVCNFLNSIFIWYNFPNKELFANASNLDLPLFVLKG